MENLKIEKIIAFVAVDENGNEGVIGIKSAEGWMPLVCADEERAISVYPYAIQASELSGQSFKIIQFTNKEDVTDSFKNRKNGGK